MPDLPTHRQFFGDREYDFALPFELVCELESVTGRGINGLCKTVFSGDFRLQEITETIRLGLIGGGVSPKDAARLVAVYAQSRPLAEIYPLAISLLELVWFGRVQDAQPKARKTRRKSHE